ncbi:glycosyltransferase family 4 protein [Candidatus Omnitrophota bacterium]
MEKKRILFIITHLELGGAQKNLLDLVKGLDPESYSLWVCAGDQGYLKKEFLKLSGLKLVFIPSLVRSINPVLDTIAFFKLLFFMKKNTFDLVHVHSPKASILGRWAAFFAGVPSIVYTVHGWPFHEFISPLSSNFYIFLERMTALITEKIIVISRHDMDKALAAKIAPKDKICLIHYGVDLERFSRVFEKRNNGAVDSKSIITVASLKPQKGLSYFLKMARSLLEESPGLRLIIAGDGPDRDKVTRQLGALGLEGKVVLAGWVEDIAGLMAKSAVLVLSSLWEGLPLAVIEGAIAGVPMVVTDTGGLRDLVVDGENAMVVPPADEKALAGAVKAMLSDYDQWARKTRMHRKILRLSDWSKETMAAKVEDLYRCVFTH